MLAGSAALGAAYSAPPLRLKRSPLLAALSIVVVRGVLVNACFYAHARANLAPRARAAAAARLPLVVAFFSLLGVAIALMKDVPDTQGDTTFGVETYARRGGRPRVFALASGLLGGTLGAGALALGVAAARAAAPARAAARLALGAALGGVALDARRRAARVDAGSGEAVADFYMHLWKCFFACYALLPFVR